MKIKYIFRKSKIRINIKKIFSILFIFIFIFLALSIFIFFYISQYSKPFIFNDIEKIEKNKVGLLLGTSPVTSAGDRSLFFITRMEAAKNLLDNKKIEYILVSGDNRSVTYNEPKYMRNYLLKLGTATSNIISDYAGRRTLDSVLRSNQIFNQNKITVISQKFHNERAIFIARKNDIEAVGFNAIYPYKNFFSNFRVNTKTFLRELLARDIAVFDLFIGKKPQILGENIEIKNENILEIKKLLPEEKA